MESKTHPQQGFRSILGILRLTKTYGDERIDAACARALRIHTISYKSVASILKNNLDRELLAGKASDPEPIAHTNIRGSDYYTTSERRKSC